MAGLDKQSTYTSIKHLDTYTNMNTLTSIKSIDDGPLISHAFKQPEVHVLDDQSQSSENAVLAADCP